MQQFYQFVLNHYLLCAAFVVLLIAIVRLELGTQVAGLRLLSPQLITSLINKHQAVVIDLRDEAAFAAGHITNAMHIPLAELDAHMKKLKKHQKKPLVLSGSDNQMLTKAAKTLREKGFDQLFAVRGGIAAWQSAQLPLVKSPSQPAIRNAANGDL